MTKRQFKAETGFDATNNKIINVAYPDRTIPTDGVNVQFLLDENTIQVYDPTRGYIKGFIVVYNNRIYSANVEIAKPAGAFDATKWTAIRTDANWSVAQGSGSGKLLSSGDQILADNRIGDVRYIMPLNPLEGEIVIIKDMAGLCHVNKITISAQQNQKFVSNTGTNEQYFSIPDETRQYVYVANGNYWNVIQILPPEKAVEISPSTQPFQLYSGIRAYRKSALGAIVYQLPKFANHGDSILSYDADGKTFLNGLTINVHPQSEDSIDVNGTKTKTLYTSVSGNLRYDAVNKIWYIWNSDNRERFKTITGDHSAVPFDMLSVINDDVKTINITFPDNANNGDIIVVSNLYSFPNTTVTLKVATGSGHKFLGTFDNFFNNKFGEIPLNIAATTKNDTMTFDKIGATLKFYYDATLKYWIATETTRRIDKVDSANRNIAGIAPLATQTEVNKNLEATPNDESIVTPKTLANKIATETERGIARIATTSEVQVITTGTHLNDVIITPKRLNERQATETIRGLAEIATQTEANDNSNDTHIITAKKLDGRRATEGLAGILPIVKSGGVVGTARGTAGTEIYNFAEHGKIVTPKTLYEMQATETGKGIGFISTQSEANDTIANAVDNTFITPKKLANRTSTEGRTGISRMVNMTTGEHLSNKATALHSNVFLTPKALAEREASETMTGISSIATNALVDLGADDFSIITPLKFKTWMAKTNISIIPLSGLTTSGNYWNRVLIDIKQPTTAQRGTARIATTIEANAQGNGLDYLIISPKKLDERRAKTTLTGLVKLATDAELDTGTLADETAINPAALMRWTRTSPNAAASDTNRGMSISANLGLTWVGNSTEGSTQLVSEYNHAPYFVTPRGLNNALVNYLPKLGKASNTTLFDGLTSSQFLRSDIDQTMKGKLSLTDLIFTNTTKGNTTVSKTDTGFIVNHGTGDILINGNNKNLITATTDAGVNLYYNGVTKLQTTATGVNIDGNLNATGAIKTDDFIYQKGIKLDDTYLPKTGGTLTGDLVITTNKINSLTIGSTGFGNTGITLLSKQQNGSTAKNNWSLTTSGGVGTEGINSLYIANLNDDGVTVKNWVLQADSNNNVFVKNSIGVGTTPVIESDAKINWNKLKSVPNASTTQAGIVQLSNAMDGTSETLAVTEKAFGLLKQIVDGKQGIEDAKYENLHITKWLQIGNLRIVPDPINKTVDMFWVDDEEL